MTIETPGHDPSLHPPGPCDTCEALGIGIYAEKIVSFESEWVNRGFTQFWNVVLLNGRLSIGARMLWATLAYYARQSDQAWPGQERIAVTMGVGERTVRTYLRELEDSGLVTTKRRMSRSNLYRLHDPSPAYMAEVDRQMLPPGEAESADEKKTQDEEDAEGNKRTEGDGGRAAATPGASPQSLPGMEPPVSPEQRASGAQGPREAALQGVWSHYVAVFGHKLRIKELTPPRSRTISKALSAVGAGPDADEEQINAARDLCIAAIDGLASYRSKNTSGSQDVSISVIFETGPHSRSSLTDQIEWWAKQAADQASLPPSIPSVHRERVMELVVAVLKLERQSVSDSVRERGEQARTILAERWKVRVHGDGTGKLKRFEVIS